jgi:hypothetical protein
VLPCSYGLPTAVQKIIPESWRPLVTDIAYDSLVQDVLSVANYWHDVQNLTLCVRTLCVGPLP